MHHHHFGTKTLLPMGCSQGSECVRQGYYYSNPFLEDRDPSDGHLWLVHACMLSHFSHVFLTQGLKPESLVSGSRFSVAWGSPCGSRPPQEVCQCFLKTALLSDILLLHHPPFFLFSKVLALPTSSASSPILLPETCPFGRSHLESLIGVQIRTR